MIGVRRGIAFLFALGLAGTALALPRIAISDEKSLDAGNVGDTFLARSEGRTWFFKKDGAIREIQRYGNFEAEMLVPRIFDRLGILAPQVRIVEIAGRRGAFMQAELVDPSFTGGGKPIPLKEWNGDLGRIDLREVRLLQLVDVLIGNGDRHDGNLFIVPMADGRDRVVPIDNNLGLATPTVVVGYYNWHLTRGFDGVAAGAEPGDPGDLLYPNHAFNSGRPERITRRNQLYQAVWDASVRGRGGLEDYAGQAEALAKALDDGFLDELVRGLNRDEVTGADHGVRVAEIATLLKSRRDRLAAWFRKFSVDATPKARNGLGWLERNLPHGIFRRLGLSARQEAFVAVRMFEGERFQPVDAYYFLKAAGVETLAAREVVLEIAKLQGVANPLKELIQAEREDPGSGYGTGLARVYAGLPAAQFQTLHGEVEAVPRWVEARAGRDRLDLLDARGNALPPAVAKALAPQLKAAMKAAGLRPGDRLCLELEAFGRDYRAWVTGPDGRLRWRGRV